MFRALGIPYQLLPVPPALFDDTVRALGAAGFGGANVTIPHKEAALAVADEPTERAAEIGAANTLTFTDKGTIKADNTDAPGFLASLPTDAAGRTAVVLGAGGAARAVIWALKHAGAEVGLWNRTPERGKAVAEASGATWLVEVPKADILVNCTSVGLGNPSSQGVPGFKSLPVGPDDLDEFSCVVDLVYRPGGTDLERAARERGIQTVDGLEVLVQQGALSYESWFGRAPDRAAMRKAAQQLDASQTAPDTE
jgi:shikimate dehydrogenase